VERVCRWFPDIRNFMQTGFEKKNYTLETKQNNIIEKKITVWLLRSNGCDGHISSFVWHAELTNFLPSVGRNTSSISTMDGSSLKRPSSFFSHSVQVCCCCISEPQQQSIHCGSDAGKNKTPPHNSPGKGKLGNVWCTSTSNTIYILYSGEINQQPFFL
jgi:hypothetical protein